jgi:hypothetical protein
MIDLLLDLNLNHTTCHQESHNQRHEESLEWMIFYLFQILNTDQFGDEQA